MGIFEKPWNYREPIGDTELYYNINNGTLELCFMGSNDLKLSWKDWAYNFAFWRWFRKDSQGKIFSVHWGLYKKWLLIKKFIFSLIVHHKPTKIIITGYSQGAALATYCHRDFVDEFGGLQPHTVIAGNPKCFGIIGLKRQRKVCESIVSYMNGNDVVTKIPFFMFHVGQIKLIGKKRKLFKLSIKDHFLEYYRNITLDDFIL